MEQRPAEDLEALEIIKREADRAAKIVSDLRLFARQTQDESSERTAVDLNDVVRHVCKVRRYSLETRGITIVEELAAGLPLVHANRGEVEQVVVNLVVNAEQAMATVPGERRLRLRTVPGITDVTLMVGDTGPGIAPEHRDRIFDPFFTTKPPGEGTGLGLSIVHSIVSEHGGQIRVDSDPRHGTTFIVELPRAAPSDRHATEEEQGPVPSPGLGLSVLLVEDEDSVRRATARYLSRLGYRVDAAAEGGEALRLLDAGEYDIVVSDLRMPGLDGEELLHRLRERGGGLERRLIFLTGDTPGASSVPEIAAEGIPVLFKPVRLDEVAREISRLATALGSGSAVDAQ
jgi:CheY-like chemotaxis protein